MGKSFKSGRSSEAFSPVRFYFYRWEMSDITAGFAYFLFLVVALLSLIGFRFGLLRWALLAALFHSLCAWA